MYKCYLERDKEIRIFFKQAPYIKTPYSEIIIDIDKSDIQDINFILKIRSKLLYYFRHKNFVFQEIPRNLVDRNKELYYYYERKCNLLSQGIDDLIKEFNNKKGGIK